MNNLQRKTTMQVASGLATCIVDPETVQRYGTSVEENMTRAYKKDLREKYHKLKEEFFEINKDGDSSISLQELITFFNNKNRTGKQFDQQYITKIFELMDRNKDNELTVNEFVEAYMETEERIRMHHVKYTKMVGELNQLNDKYQKQLEENRDEQFLPNGLSKQAGIYITVFEAKELTPLWTGSADPFASLTFEGQTKQSKLQIGRLDPAWNEDFHFEVTNPSSILKVEIFSKQTLGPTQSLGFVEITLNELQDQERTDKWYNIINGTKALGNGQLRLKLQFIHFKRKYFEDQILKTSNKLIALEAKRNILDDYTEYMKESFGIIHLGNINDNLRRIIYNEDQIIKEIETNRKSVYAKRAFVDTGHTLVGTVQGIFTGTIKPAQIKWGNLSKIMMYLSIGLSVIVLLERSDFVNLLISMAIWILFVYDKKNDIENYLMPLIITIGVSLAYDFIWLFIKYNSFWKGSVSDYELGIKNWVYFFSFANFIIKIMLIVSLWLLKNKKNKAKTSSSAI